MLAVRKTQPGVRPRPAARSCEPGNRKVLAYLREYGDEAILCVANLARSAQPVELDLARFKGRVPVELLGRTPFPPIGELPYLLTLPAPRLLLVPARDRRRRCRAGTRSGSRARTCRCWCCSTAGRASSATASCRGASAWREKVRAQLETEVLPRYLAAQRWYAAKGESDRSARGSSTTRVWEVRGEQLAARAGRGRGRRRDRALLRAAGARLGGHATRSACSALAPAALAKVRQQANVGVLADAFADEAFCRARRRGDRRAAASSPPRAARCASRRPRAFAELAGDDFARAAGRHGRRRRAATRSSRSASGCSSRATAGCGPASTPSSRSAASSPRSRASRTACRSPGRSSTSAPTARRRRSRCCRPTSRTRATAGPTRSTTSSASSRRSAPSPSAPPADVHGALPRAHARRSACAPPSCTARSRAATGDPAFDPEPVTARRRRGLEGARRATTLRATLDAARAAAATSCPRPRATRRRRLLGGASALLARIDALPRAAGRARQDALPRRLPPRPGAAREQRLRDHRLRRRAGAAARRSAARKHSPLRDVAGMLRSFSYARWTRARRARREAPEDDARLAPLAARLGGRGARARSSPAYDEAARGAGLYAIARRRRAACCELFELEKALYELRYEIDNRPDWVRDPARRASARCSAPAGRAERGRRRRSSWKSSTCCSSRCARCCAQIGAFLPRLALALSWC